MSGKRKLVDDALQATDKKRRVNADESDQIDLTKDEQAPQGTAPALKSQSTAATRESFEKQCADLGRFRGEREYRSMLEIVRSTQAPAQDYRRFLRKLKDKDYHFEIPSNPCTDHGGETILTELAWSVFISESEEIKAATIELVEELLRRDPERLMLKWRRTTHALQMCARKGGRGYLAPLFLEAWPEITWVSIKNGGWDALGESVRSRQMDVTEAITKKPVQTDHVRRAFFEAARIHNLPALHHFATLFEHVLDPDEAIVDSQTCFDAASKPLARKKVNAYKTEYLSEDDEAPDFKVERRVKAAEQILLRMREVLDRRYQLAFTILDRSLDAYFGGVRPLVDLCLDYAGRSRARGNPLFNH